MAGEPQAPGAPAIIWYREVDRNDNGRTGHGGAVFIGSGMQVNADRFEDNQNDLPEARVKVSGEDVYAPLTSKSAASSSTTARSASTDPYFFSSHWILSDGIVRLVAGNIPTFQSEDFMPPENELKERVDFIYSFEPFEMDVNKFWKQVGKKRNEKLESFVGKPGRWTKPLPKSFPPMTRRK
jgi:hypothetical protein